MKKGKELQNGYSDLLQNCRVGRSCCANHFYPMSDLGDFQKNEDFSFSDNNLNIK